MSFTHAHTARGHIRTRVLQCSCYSRPPPPPPPPLSCLLWSATQTQTRAIYGGLCGMPASADCGHAVGCGVCDTPVLWRGAAGLCVRVRACGAVVPPTLYIYIHTRTYARRFFFTIVICLTLTDETRHNTNKIHKPKHKSTQK